MVWCWSCARNAMFNRYNGELTKAINLMKMLSSDASSLPNAGGFGKQKDQHLEVCWYLFLGGCYAWWDTLVCLSSKCLLFIFRPKWSRLPWAKDRQWPWDADTAAMDMAGFTRRNQSPINSKVKNLHHLSPIFSCPWVGSGGFCPISARSETEVRFDGPLCWQNSVADLEECKTYTSYTGTQLWQCLNSTLVEMVMRWTDFQVVIVFWFISTLGAGDVVDAIGNLLWCELDLTFSRGRACTLSVVSPTTMTMTTTSTMTSIPYRPKIRDSGRERERERELININIDLIDIKTKQPLVDKLLHQLEYLKQYIILFFVILMSSTFNKTCI